MSRENMCYPLAVSRQFRLRLGADHILFSADYPYAPLDAMTQFVETAPLSEIDKEKICHLNAERLLKLPG